MKTLKTRILIADDDAIYREVGREALEQAGHDVTLAADGAEAIAALQSQPFQAAMIDLTMPKADGVAVIEAVRAGGANMNTPIVVVTGHDDTSAIERAYNAGATSFLTKPLNWLLFTHHINFVVRSGRTETELRETTTAAAFLSDLKSHMMGALAREFQSPIKTIYGFSELIRREVYGPLGPPAYRDMALDMGNAAQKLNASFLKLMDLGNTLSEQLELKIETFALNETISGILASVAEQAERRNVKLEPRLNIPADLTMDADRVLFIQAVRGIIANAVKIAPRNTSVEVHAWIGEQGELKISALDHGPAISASIIAEIKRSPAHRPGHGQDADTRDVGVRIAKVLTEAHQGRLDVHIDNHGTNLVRLEFPKSRLTRVTAGATDNPLANVARPEGEGAASRIAEISAALAQDPRVRLSHAQRDGRSYPFPGSGTASQGLSPSDIFDLIGEGRL
ncbi:MAG: response regulator [Hyphomicrobium sp.]